MRYCASRLLNPTVSCERLVESMMEASRLISSDCNRTDEVDDDDDEEEKADAAGSWEDDEEDEAAVADDDLAG